MPETVEFEYGREEKVRIKCSGMQAKVLLLFVNKQGVRQFCCQYVDTTGVIHKTYFHAEDLEAWLEETPE